MAPPKSWRHFAQGSIEQKEPGNFSRGKEERREREKGTLRSWGAQCLTSWEEVSCLGACTEGAGTSARKSPWMEQDGSPHTGMLLTQNCNNLKVLEPQLALKAFWKCNRLQRISTSTSFFHFWEREGLGSGRPRGKLAIEQDKKPRFSAIQCQLRALYTVPQCPHSPLPLHTTTFSKESSATSSLCSYTSMLGSSQHPRKLTLFLFLAALLNIF